MPSTKQNHRVSLFIIIIIPAMLFTPSLNLFTEVVVLVTSSNCNLIISSLGLSILGEFIFVSSKSVCQMETIPVKKLMISALRWQSSSSLTKFFPELAHILIPHRNRCFSPRPSQDGYKWKCQQGRKLLPCYPEDGKCPVGISSQYCRYSFDRDPV